MYFWSYQYFDYVYRLIKLFGPKPKIILIRNWNNATNRISLLSFFVIIIIRHGPDLSFSKISTV